MRLVELHATTLAFLACNVMQCGAQTVTVQSGNETGHGFLIQSAETCVIVLPKHVAAGSRRVTVFTATPVTHASALIETPFWEGIDLAVGVVRGALDGRCTRTIDDLAGSARPETGTNAQLLRLRQSGEPERIDMVVVDSSYLTLDAEITDGQSELFKGTSGAFLFDGDTPIGMIVEALSPTRGRFIRIEEIHQNIARRLSRSSGFSIETEGEQETTSSQETLPFRFVSATLPPENPEHSTEGMSGPGSYIFRLTKPNRIAFQAEGGASISLSGVSVRSDLDANATAPRIVTIEVSSDEDGVRVRPFIVGEMGSDGILEVTRSPTRARWVYLTIGSGWDGTLVGIDSITFR